MTGSFTGKGGVAVVQKKSLPPSFKSSGFVVIDIETKVVYHVQMISQSHVI